MAEDKKTTDKPKTDKSLKFIYKGQKYRFKKSAPPTLNVDGIAVKLETIIKNKEVMTELIVGRNNFIEIVNT